MVLIIRQNAWVQFSSPLPLILRQRVMYVLYRSTLCEYIIDALFMWSLLFFFKWTAMMCDLRSVYVCFRVCIVCQICDVSVIYANRLYILIDLHESICSESRCLFMTKKDTRNKKADAWEILITERTFTVCISINFILWFLTRHFI